MPEALLLDFDGLMVDTETTGYESWRFVYEAYGAELPRDLWVTHIGTDGKDFSPMGYLSELTGTDLVGAVNRRRRAHRSELFLDLCPLPGVVDWLGEARTRGIAIGVVSSSPTEWVQDHLERVALREHVDFLKTRDDVPRAKPHRTSTSTPSSTWASTRAVPSPSRTLRTGWPLQRPLGSSAWRFPAR